MISRRSLPWLGTGRTRTAFRPAKVLGCSLNEIRELLALRVGGVDTCERVRERTRSKIDDIERKIRALQDMKGALLPLLTPVRNAERPMTARLLTRLKRMGGSKQTREVTMADTIETRDPRKLGLLAVPGVVVSLLPSLTCPLCWPGYAALLSSFGLAFFDLRVASDRSGELAAREIDVLIPAGQTRSEQPREKRKPSTNCPSRPSATTSRQRFTTARGTFASYVGVVPRLHQSGKRRFSANVAIPLGNARLRRALWMPVLVARQSLARSSLPTASRSRKTPQSRDDRLHAQAACRNL